MLAVAAVDEETAESALDLIRVDYEILPLCSTAGGGGEIIGPETLSGGERGSGSADT